MKEIINILNDKNINIKSIAYILAYDAFIFDTNLDFKGLNLYLNSPLWIANQQYIVDISGRDAENHTA
jgi:hypothetical protein